MNDRDPEATARTRQTSLGARADAGMSRGERVRLVILFGLGVVLTALFLISRAQEANPEAPQPTVDVAEASETAIPGEEDVLPWEPPLETIADELDESTQQGRRDPRTEALALLANALVKRRHIHFLADPDYAEVGGFTPIADPAGLLDPAKAKEARGEPIEIKGRVIAAKEIEPSFYGLDRLLFSDKVPLIEGWIRSGDQPVRFLLVESPNDRESALPEPGELYKLRGVFYRIWEEQLEGEEGFTTMPYVLATRFVPAITIEATETRSVDLIERIVSSEESFISRAPHKEAAFLETLGYTLGAREELLAEAEASDSVLTIVSGRDPLLRPEKFRLRVVGVKGQLVYLKAESFEVPDLSAADSPIQHYWHAVVMSDDPNRNIPASVMIPDDLVSEEMREWAYLPHEERAEQGWPSVDVRALYYRVHAFSNRKGTQDQTRLPMVIALEPMHLTLPEPVEKPDDSSFFIAFLSVGLLMTGALIFMLWRDRRRSAADDSERRSARLQRRRGAWGGSGAASADGAMPAVPSSDHEAEGRGGARGRKGGEKGSEPKAGG